MRSASNQRGSKLQTRRNKICRAPRASPVKDARAEIPVVVKFAAKRGAKITHLSRNACYESMSDLEVPDSAVLCGLWLFANLVQLHSAAPHPNFRLSFYSLKWSDEPCGPARAPARGPRAPPRSRPELKGSIGEGPNHSNHSNHANSFKIRKLSLDN